jgi:putative transposase
MARLPRFRLPDQPQQVIVRGNDRAAIFHDDADYRHLYSILVAAMERF